VELAGGVIGQEFWVKVSDAYWLFDDRYAAKGLREKSKENTAFTQAIKNLEI
jgi:hypothetical protein